MATQISVCNLALTRIGAQIISDITDTDKASVRCNRIWDLELKTVLEAAHWPFATRIIPLTKLRMDEALPHTTWDYAYRLPADLLSIIKIADDQDILNVEDSGGKYELAEGPFGDELITNGAMEDDSNWANVGSPTTNEQSTGKVKAGTYSRKFTVQAADEGINSDDFTTTTNYKYVYGLWVYPDDTETVNIYIQKGDNSGANVDRDVDGLDQDDWNYISGEFTEAAGGSGAYLNVRSPTGQTSGTWYVDMVTLSPMANVLYSDLDDAYMKYVAELGLMGDDTVPDNTQIALFSPSFVDALAWRLAADLAQSLANSSAKAELALKAYNYAIKEAKKIAAHEVQKPTTYTDSWLNARN